ncbi:hypothetical protein GH714_031642 [Hevea brasiliensis]|uniref:VQ domain-containing protein n=1 Tax=Hevea brasiliensis TaxID=3981 RepID=A0A6A6M5G3_HEVBR|nr:hypothetical protein GH714_031642 [Hevea brasiliensis]
MEDIIMKKQACIPTSSPTRSPLAMHKDSQTISKVKPKIRIIHIFAPEIIKTDVANFRELVQRLTGKPAEKSPKKKSRIPRGTQDQPTVRTKKVELRTGFGNLGSRDKVKEEDGMWNGANSGGFLAGFADLDGFIQELEALPP